MSDAHFEARVARALRAPLAASSGATGAIMDRVRQAARTDMPRRRTSSPLLTGPRHAIIGLAMAAGIGSITTLSGLATRSAAPAHTLTTAVLGDTVVDAFRDTLRLVRLMLDAPAGQRVAVVGDFNGWRPDATPMHRDRGGRWTVTLALRAGEHRYAIVADETRWAAESTDARGRAYSLLRVTRAID